MSVRRPARTCVLPVPRGPDHLNLHDPLESGNWSTGYIMPDNAYIQSFNGKFRAECLNAHWFLTAKSWRSGADTTIMLHNTHLSMLLKKIGFADWDAIPWGILGFAEHGLRVDGPQFYKVLPG
jgi:hypothetical protein